jgi:lipopolysaccharide transport system ATP-binding protein
MSSEPVVLAEKVSKCYRVYDHPRDRLRQAFVGDRKKLYREFWALREISFRLHPGQTLGIIGRNGSGKSTLLQMLCGTLTPSSGHIQTRGRIGALLELGSGFNPEFTGRENVFLNASLLGLSRIEIEAHLDEILTFADIGEFIDQPVKTYSSGMAVRLAFAVQAHTEPDILVVDEALAVGDELFQKKCYAHLERLKEKGTSVLLVTHSCPQIVQHCDQALLLHKGRARLHGDPVRVTLMYQRLINAADEEWEACLGSGGDQSSRADAPAALPALDSTSSDAEAGRAGAAAGREVSTAWFDPDLKPESTEVYPEHGARIRDVRITDLAGEPLNVLPFRQDFAITFDYEALRDLDAITLACHIANHTGQRISGQSLKLPAGEAVGQGDSPMSMIPSGTRWSCCFRFHGGLWPGLYFIGGGILQQSEEGRTFLHRVVDFRALKVIATSFVNVIGACNLELQPPEIQASAAP